MEQSWPVDKYDVPRGDLEFWARRRGILRPANESAGRASTAGPRTASVSALLKRAVAITSLSVAFLVVVQALA